MCLRALEKKLFHVGIRGKVSRSTLADANDTRDWRIYRDLANGLIAEATKLYVDEPFGVDLKEAVYVLDASIITLCLSIFPWARYTSQKGGIKLHTQLDLRGNIPVFITVFRAEKPYITVIVHFLRTHRPAVSVIISFYVSK